MPKTMEKLLEEKARKNGPMGGARNETDAEQAEREARETPEAWAKLKESADAMRAERAAAKAPKPE